MKQRGADYSKPLAPGPALSEMSTNAAREMTQVMNEESAAWNVKNLHTWLRDINTYATASGL